MSEPLKLSSTVSDHEAEWSNLEYTRRVYSQTGCRGDNIELSQQQEVEEGSGG
jgi:hypothetical protein